MGNAACNIFSSQSGGKVAKLAKCYISALYVVVTLLASFPPLKVEEKLQKLHFHLICLSNTACKFSTAHSKGKVANLAF